MAQCMYCGAQIPDGSKFCTSCGNAIPQEAPAAQSYQDPASQTYQQPYDQQYQQQPYQQQPYQQQQLQQQPYQQQYQQPYAQPYQQPELDTGSIGWGVLGFFIPIVGLILFLVWKDTKPKSAKVAGMGALISVILGVVFYVIGFGLALSYR